MAGTKKLRVLIVDDEPAARRKTRRFLEEDDDVEITGEASNGTDAVDKIFRERPDLVFLDIQMPDVDGFDVVAAIAGTEHVPKFIFVTAHDQYAVKAFEVSAVDYLLKPFDRERFATALVRGRQSVTSLAPEDQLQLLLDSLRPAGRFLRR
ncbi:MAG: response regulator transcription factor, partial [Candidatus Eremiobacteraeota bacterium]|nr:response regulator transcription factor [Candidatus Eremiobacteraeota bacterium]